MSYTISSDHHPRYQLGQMGRETAGSVNGQRLYVLHLRLPVGRLHEVAAQISLMASRECNVTGGYCGGDDAERWHTPNRSTVDTVLHVYVYAASDCIRDYVMDEMALMFAPVGASLTDAFDWARSIRTVGGAGHER